MLSIQGQHCVPSFRLYAFDAGYCYEPSRIEYILISATEAQAEERRKAEKREENRIANAARAQFNLDRKIAKWGEANYWIRQEQNARRREKRRAMPPKPRKPRQPKKKRNQQVPSDPAGADDQALAELRTSFTHHPLPPRPEGPFLTTAGYPQTWSTLPVPGDQTQVEPRLILLNTLHLPTPTARPRLRRLSSTASRLSLSPRPDPPLSCRSDPRRCVRLHLSHRPLSRRRSCLPRDLHHRRFRS